MAPATHDLQASLDAAVAAGIPGVTAGVTDAAGTLWLGASGVRSLASARPAEPDTVVALHSVTKAITTTAALQCVEDGLIDLDAPARESLPAIGDLRVLRSFAVEGEEVALRTRPLARDITARMLLHHTAGLAYDIFDETYAALARARMRHPSGTPLWDSLQTPLLHDPGERWTYGTSLDWLGLIVAAVRGRRLEDVFRERIFASAGMTSTSFDVSPAMRERLSALHRRRGDGSVTASTAGPPERPELDMGGQGLFSTVPDVLSFLRVWLNDGDSPGGRVLRSETVAWAVQGVAGLAVTPLRSAIPAMTRDVDFFPGLRTSWSTSFLVNDEEVHGGRRAGSLSWAGVSNVHYWIDRASGLAAVWAAQLFPFFDPVVRDAVTAFERAVYRAF